MSHYLFFATVSLIAVAIPGPDFLLIVQTSLRRGKRPALLSALGIGCGLCVHGTFATIGLSALLLKSARAFEIVKWLGVAYLAFLAVMLLVDLVRSKSRQDSEDARNGEVSSVSAKKYILRGFLNNVLNIKVALFFVAIVPQFVVGSHSATSQIAVLSIIQVVVSLAWLSSLALAVNRLGVFLKRRVVQRWLDGATATIFLGLAGKLASTARH